MTKTEPRAAEPLFDTIAVIGPGLIGSSIMRAARAKGAVRSIVATSRSPKTRKRVVELGIADKVVETEEVVKGAISSSSAFQSASCGAVAKEIGPHLKAGATISDVGSVKGVVVRDMGPSFAEDPFISCPPIRSPAPTIPGPDAGFAELFEGRWCVRDPPEGPTQRRCKGSRLSGGCSGPMSNHDAGSP